MTKISIIIPILNEAKTITKLFKHLNESSSEENIKEIIVVDGGSTDESLAIISTFKDITLIHSDKGRAKQMNVGAKHASGNILYFLHADSFPPKDFDTSIVNEVLNGHLAGCFKMKFDSNHWWLMLMGWFTKFPWRICRGGDQSLFITKSLFDSLKGFDEQYFIYEDNVFIKKLFNIKQFTVIQKHLTTSARLYKKHGIWKLQYHYLIIHLKHWLGASSKDLFAYYIQNVCTNKS
ncbi:TIGR04283 family arsenosugar biosynthesis glycosyltransferase [Yeosuana sp. AK3]